MEASKSAYDSIDEGKFSAPVRNVFSTLARGEYDALRVHVELSRIHKEYAPYHKYPDGLVEFFKSQNTAVELPKRSVNEWAEIAISLVVPDLRKGLIDGRRLAIALLLSEYDPVASRVADKKRWKEICTGLLEEFRSEIDSRENPQPNASPSSFA